MAVRVFLREVEEEDAGEDDEEAAEEGDGVDRGGCVEALEEDEGGAEDGGGEGYVVDGAYTVGWRCVSKREACFWERVFFAGRGGGGKVSVTRSGRWC